MQCEHGPRVFVADVFHLPPDAEPIGPMALEVTLTPVPVPEGSGGSRGKSKPYGAHPARPGFEEGARWRRYYELVRNGWERALHSLEDASGEMTCSLCGSPSPWLPRTSASRDAPRRSTGHAGRGPWIDAPCDRHESEEAQKFYDQGLTFIYAFNHDEAVRSFRRAAGSIPNSPMPLWDVALALGPDINLDVDQEREKAAFDAVQQALKLAANAPPAERAYVEALAETLLGQSKADLKALAVQYKNAMAALVKQYPERSRCGHALCREHDGPASVAALGQRRYSRRRHARHRRRARERDQTRRESRRGQPLLHPRGRGPRSRPTGGSRARRNSRRWSRLPATSFTCRLTSTCGPATTRER